jgi:hypothetical protein
MFVLDTDTFTHLLHGHEWVTLRRSQVTEEVVLTAVTRGRGSGCRDGEGLVGLAEDGRGEKMPHGAEQGTGDRAEPCWRLCVSHKPFLPDGFG